VTFFALLSVFPGLLAVVATIGWLDGVLGEELAREAEARVVDFLETFLTDHAAGTTEAVRSLFEHGDGGVLTFGIVGFLWSGSRGMSAVLRALADIYDAEDQRSPLLRRLLALALVAGSAVVAALLLAMLVLGPLLGLGEWLAASLGVANAYGTLWSWLSLPVAFLVLLTWATVMMHAAAHNHRRWHEHLYGAAVTGVGCLLGSFGFRVYLDLLGGNQVYGLLGGALVVLLWLYVLSVALLAGAEVDAVLTEQRTQTGDPPGGDALDGAASSAPPAPRPSSVSR